MGLPGTIDTSDARDCLAVYRPLDLKATYANVVSPVGRSHKYGSAQPFGMTVVSDEEVLGGEPRIDGTRVGVRHVAVRVVDAGRSPASVADQLDVPLGAVYEALAYYYDNLDEIRAAERANARARDRVRENGLAPKEPVS
jgi:uncharacterized protein (DUF433 family)